MITIEQSGDFSNLEKLLKGASKIEIHMILDRYGQRGVNALQSATPKDTGLTASSWDYIVEDSKDSYSITWTNSNIVDGVPIALILQYGHGTGTGGYVTGIDYINPALREVFNDMADEVWKEVTGA